MRKCRLHGEQRHRRPAYNPFATASRAVWSSCLVLSRHHVATIVASRYRLQRRKPCQLSPIGCQCTSVVSVHHWHKHSTLIVCRSGFGGIVCYAALYFVERIPSIIVLFLALTCYWTYLCIIYLLANCSWPIMFCCASVGLSVCLSAANVGNRQQIDP